MLCVYLIFVNWLNLFFIAQKKRIGSCEFDYIGVFSDIFLGLTFSIRSYHEIQFFKNIYKLFS